MDMHEERNHKIWQDINLDTAAEMFETFFGGPVLREMEEYGFGISTYPHFLSCMFFFCYTYDKYEKQI